MELAERRLFKGMINKKIVLMRKKVGKGVFANKNFKKGDIIIHVDYRKSKDIVKKEYIPKLSLRDGDHLCYLGRRKYVIDYSPFAMVNHSCNPNSYVRYRNMKIRYLVSLREIKKGEEVVCDYVIDTFGDLEIKCHCWSKNCRKIIYTNYFKLPKNLQEKYWRYVPRWKKRMLKKI